MGYATPLEGYRPSVGAMRDFLQTYSGQEPGDPRKAAVVIIGITDEANPPLRLPLGNDALAVLRHGYKANADERPISPVPRTSTASPCPTRNMPFSI